MAALQQAGMQLRTISLRCAACHAPHTRLLGVLCSLVLYAADQPLALFCELVLRQASHDHAHPSDGIACSAEHLGRFSEPSVRSYCSLHLKNPATCTACI